PLVVFPCCRFFVRFLAARLPRVRRAGLGWYGRSLVFRAGVPLRGGRSGSRVCPVAAVAPAVVQCTTAWVVDTPRRSFAAWRGGEADRRGHGRAARASEPRGRGAKPRKAKPGSPSVARRAAAGRTERLTRVARA